MPEWRYKDNPPRFVITCRAPKRLLEPAVTVTIRLRRGWTLPRGTSTLACQSTLPPPPISCRWPLHQHDPMKYHKSAHSKPAILGRQVKRKKHRLPPLQARSQNATHTAEAGILPYDRRSPARPARHAKGERAGDDISARSDRNSLHLQVLPVTTQQRVAQSSHNHAVAGLSPGMSSIRAARVVE